MSHSDKFTKIVIMSKDNELCPCGSGKTYAECCEPIIKGKTKAPTAEACMRARYSSYVKHEIDYIINSCIEGDEVGEIDRKATEDWSKQSQWNGLKILNTEKGEKRMNTLLNLRQIIHCTRCMTFITKFLCSAR